MYQFSLDNIVCNSFHFHSLQLIIIHVNNNIIIHFLDFQDFKDKLVPTKLIQMIPRISDLSKMQQLVCET